MLRFTAFLVVWCFVAATGNPAEKQAHSPSGLERVLLGEWQGPACGGDWTYRADGTFETRHYSPGNNHLAGTWKVRWNALPPTLVRTCKTSDDPDLVGKTWEVKLVQLDDAALAYQYSPEHTVRYTRVTARERAERELDELQGTWVPLYFESKGQSVETNFKQIIKGDKVTFQVDGETKAEGKVVLDLTKNPSHLNFEFTSGQTDLILYVRAGDFVIYCGNRDGKTRPTEFASGTAKGGEYLQVWKIER